jgi:hypothetical protein
VSFYGFARCHELMAVVVAGLRDRLGEHGGNRPSPVPVIRLTGSAGYGVYSSALWSLLYL